MDIHLDCRLEIIRTWVVAHVSTQCLKQDRWCRPSGVAGAERTGTRLAAIPQGSIRGSAVGGGACKSWNLGRWFPRTLRAIGLAEEQADRLLAVPINHGNVRFASHCRRNADIALCPRNLHKRGSPSSLSVAASTSVAVDVLGRFRLARKDDGVHSAIIPKFKSRRADL